jgi:hypothetical protein
LEQPYVQERKKEQEISTNLKEFELSEGYGKMVAFFEKKRIPQRVEKGLIENVAGDAKAIVIRTVRLASVIISLCEYQTICPCPCCFSPVLYF